MDPNTQYGDCECEDDDIQENPPQSNEHTTIKRQQMSTGDDQPESQKVKAEG